MKGKEFESRIIEQCRIDRAEGRSDIGRYGVQAAPRGDGNVIVMKSLPDFEGLVRGIPRQVIFDAKVCSGASFSLKPFIEHYIGGNQHRQLRHMLGRSRFGAVCGFLIHWNARELKTRADPPETVFFPVHHSMQFWDEFLRGEIKKLSRSECREIGAEVVWKCSAGGTKPRPALVETLRWWWQNCPVAIRSVADPME